MFFLSLYVLAEINMLTWLIPVVLALDPAKVKYAVNCGGPLITTSDDVIYFADTGYSSGIVSDFGKSVQIKLTKFPEVYQTERYALSDFSYSIPLEEPGKYVLILKFSEVWFNQAQEKLFSVRIGDVVVIENLDIFDQVGKYAAYDEFVPFEFEDGKVLIKGKEAKGSVQKNKLKIDFLKTDYDNPKINAIVLFKGKLEETNYNEQKRYIESLKRQMQEEINKEERGYRTDKVFEDETDFEDFGGEDPHIIIEENQSLWSVLSSVPAMVIIAFVLVLGVAACIPTRASNAPSAPSKPKRT